MTKINIAELLKDCPKGMELDCTMYDNLYFNCIREHPIYPITCWTVDSKGNKHDISFNWYGKSSIVDTAKCVIFPKGKTTWEGFQLPFKDGDVVVFENPDTKYLQIFIFKCKEENNALSECYLMLDGNMLCLGCGMYYVTRLATEEEKKQLFDALAKEGKIWDAEKKKVVDLKWKPQEEEKYYYPAFYYTYIFKVSTHTWVNDEIDNKLYDRGFIFPLTEDGKDLCKALCDKLNNAIEEVKS